MLNARAPADRIAKKLRASVYDKSHKRRVQHFFSESGSLRSGTTASNPADDDESTSAQQGLNKPRSTRKQIPSTLGCTEVLWSWAWTMRLSALKSAYLSSERHFFSGDEAVNLTSSCVDVEIHTNWGLAKKTEGNERSNS